VLGWLLVSGAWVSPALAAGGAAAPRPPGRTLDGGAGRPWGGQGRPQGVPRGREYRTGGRNGPPLTGEGPGCYLPSCQQIGRAGWAQGSQPAAPKGRGGRCAPRADRGHRRPWPGGHRGGHTGGQQVDPGTRGGQRGGRRSPGGVGGAAGLDRVVRLADIPAASPWPAPLSCPSLNHRAPARGGRPGLASGGSWAVAASGASGQRPGGVAAPRWGPSQVPRVGRCG
jgi:hypothetical protein